MYQYRWRLFFGVLFIVLGAVWLWNSLDLGPNIPICSLWPVLLIALGIYIIMRQTVWANRSDMIDRIIGDLRLFGPGAEVSDKNIFTIIGDVDLDLRGSHIPEGETTIHIRSIIGDIDVILPSDVGVFASASAMVGDLKVLGRRSDGFFRDVSQTTPDYAMAARKVRIAVDMVIGDAMIIRAA